jgi:decaprenylphospho-beta-D-ribofuranose 2-oxidase
MKLSGWGRFPAAECKTMQLRERSEIAQALERCPSLIARGNGRAYGDAAINPDATLLMGQCDRFLAFDAKTGILECEAGVLLSDLLTVVVPRGWFPGVVPGTKFATVGGLIAADVHGKNHHRDGSFGRYVESLRLALADGSIVTCSQTENCELFAATIGGMGLTGVILSAQIRLRPIRSSSIGETTIRAPTLETLFRLFAEHDTATYSVAWIDCLAKGRQFGRGILMLGEHVEPTERSAGSADPFAQDRSPSTISVPIDLPGSPVNAWTIRLFNEAYYRLHRPGHRIRHYDGFFFPLDKIGNWNSIYGKRGFVQYQCVIRGRDAERAIHEIIRLVSASGSGTFLTVLKKLGPGNRYMSFPMEGYTITLDFPVRADTMGNLAKLDAVVAEHKGRIYLAKDARAPRELIEAGYSEITAFRELRKKIDPNRRFRSLLSERLGL